MSYATYVAATIHVRIAAQREPGSDAHASLSTCLYVFNKNQETNWAVRRARTVILNLMKRMNVTLREEDILQGNNTSGNANLRSNGGSFEQASTQAARINPVLDHTQNINNRPHNHISPDLDMDAIIQSFIREQQNKDPTQSYNAMQGLEPGTMSSTSSMSQNLPAAVPVSFDGGYANQAWNIVDFQADSSLEDMIFGFNGPGVDGMW